jgi:hypothetical protein
MSIHGPPGPDQNLNQHLMSYEGTSYISVVILTCYLFNNIFYLIFYFIRVYIEKSSEPLGIQIFCRNSGGVFVSSVHQSSLAAQVGLQVGDQLLEVCGINMRSATYQLAACVLHQCGDSITMLVQYNPTKYQELQEMNGMNLMGPPSMTSSSSECDGNGEGSHQRSKSRSGSPTPCNSPRHSRDHSNNSGNGSSSKADILDPGAATLRNTLQFDRYNN